MDYNLQLRRGGTLVTSQWDIDKKDYTECEVHSDELSFYLYDSICFENGITLRDIFSFINKNVDLFSIITTCPFLNDLVKESLSIPIKNKNKIFSLKIERKINLFKKDKDNFISVYFEFYAVGENEKQGIEFYPINELTYLPIILNENIVMGELKAKMEFTLLEVMKCIIDELSFAGPPDLKSYMLKEFNGKTDGLIDKNEKCYILDEIEKKIKDDLENNKRPCKICGEDSRSPQFNKPKDICDKCYERIREN